MKKNIFTLSTLAVVAIAQFSCAKVETEIENSVVSKGVPFEIYAGSELTKTVNSNNDISWEAGNSINLFHAEAGATSYGANDQFTITSENLTANKFTGTLSAGALDPEKNYDWYALYPYSSYISTPNNTSSGYLSIGSADKSTAQVQAGNNSMDHLSGEYFPLFGNQKNVAAATAPSLTLKPALSVIKIHVTNKKTADLVVNSIAVVAPEDIVGQYFIKFIDDEAVFTGKSSSTSKTALLDVTSGSAISTDTSADFYIAVKPFTATADSKLTVVVNGYPKTVTLASAFTFEAGKVHKLDFNYNAPDYDQLVYTTTGITGSSYTNWSGIAGTYSSAVYAGNSNGNDKNYIQIRATSPSGIVTTATGGYLNKVAVTWNTETVNGRKVFIYGSNTPYTSSADLYDVNTAGTKIGEITKGTDTEVISTEYFAYIGIVANGGAVFMDEVDIYWGAAKAKVNAPTGVTATATGTTINVNWTDVVSNVGSYIVTCTGQAPQVIAQGTRTAAFTSLPNGTYTVTVQAVPSDVTLATGSYSYSDVVTVADVEVTGGVSEVWKLTNLADITTSDVFVIVGNDSYAMTNDNGAGVPPATVAVTSTTEGGITKLDGTIANNIKWNLTKSDDNYTFYPNGVTTTWLYCNTTAKSSSNNNIRVGTGDRKVFEFNSSNQLVTSDTYVARYLSIYNNADWRGYTTDSSAATITFYVLQP